MSLDILRRVLMEEAAAISLVADRLDPNFQLAVEWIYGCQGRVATCGIGKSGHIARKASGTFSSTGTPSFYMHLAEAMHGDLGMLQMNDIALLYSYSGETDELIRLFPALHSMSVRTLLLTGRPDSTAARQSSLVLNVMVPREACPNDLAPTSSTTVMLAVSDALAVAVMERRGFSREDFARFHPSGSLGKRLLLRVRDVMRTGDQLAIANTTDSVVDVMASITRAGAGAACILAEDGRLAGFVSDGDIRRYMLQGGPIDGTAAQMMTSNVTTISPDLLAVEALEFLQNLPKKVGELPVIDSGRLVGLLVLKDLLRSGIV